MREFNPLMRRMVFDKRPVMVGRPMEPCATSPVQDRDRRLPIRAWGLVVVAIVSCAVAADAAEFTSLGVIHGHIDANGSIGLFWSMSDDGDNIVGTIRELDAIGRTLSDTGFHWTADLGMQTLDQRYGLDGQARAISADGSTMAGLRAVNNASQSYRLSVGSEEVAILDAPSGFRQGGSVYGISNGGEVAVGVGNLDAPGSPNRAIRWDSEGNAITIDRTAISEDHVIQPTWARAVSSNGNVIVGDADVIDRNGDYVRFGAFQWTAEDGAQLLDATDFSPRDVSADGRWKVGHGSIGPGDTNRRSQRLDGLSIAEPLLPENEQWGTAAVGISNDGSVAVGVIYPTDDRSESYAGIWTEERGFVSLQDVLVEDYGLGDDLEGWRLYRAFDISGDARYVTGLGINPHGDWEGFRVDLAVPEPAGLILLLTALLAIAVLRWRSTSESLIRKRVFLRLSEQFLRD